MLQVKVLTVGVALGSMLIASTGISAQQVTPLSNDSPPAVATQVARPAMPEKGPDVTLSPGDLIEVNVLGEPDLSTKLRISESGEIALAVGGPISVLGLTVDEASAAIQRELRDGGFVNEPYVRVFVDESIASGVTILGEVKAPGVFPVFGHHDLFDLISLAGGLLPTAGRDVAIQHKADPDHPEVVHLSTSIRPGTSGNVPILPGDKIVVSAAGVVYVLGAVGRPGGFMLSRNEENYSILKLLSLANGFMPTAKLKGAVLIRKTDTGVTQYALSISEILSGKQADMNIEAGDIVYVPSSTAKILGYRSLEAVFSTVTGLAVYGRL